MLGLQTVTTYPLLPSGTWGTGHAWLELVQAGPSLQPYPTLFRKFIYLFTLHPHISPPLLPELPSHRSSPIPITLSSEKRDLPSVLCHPTLARQITGGGSTEVRQGGPTRETGSAHSRQQIQGQLLGCPREDQAAPLLHMCRGLGPACVHSLVGGSIFESPQWSRLVDPVGVLVESLSPLRSSILPPTLPQDSFAPSNVCLWVSASFSISCWWSLSGQLC